MRKEFEGRSQRDHEEFWNVDEELGQVSLYDATYTARFRGHVGAEPYRARRDLVSLSRSSGIRDYVLIHPYILVPSMSIQADLSRNASDGTVRGSVASSRWDGMRQERFGDGQAWFYREDRTLVLWECLPFARHRQPDPARDATLQTVWDGFERFLRRRFSAARRIVTPADEPEYDREAWEAFLRQRGFQRWDDGVYGKEVDGQP